MSVKLDVRSLSSLSFRDAPDVGGKAAALGEMLGRGFPVFDGVAIRCSQYTDVLRRTCVDDHADSFWRADPSDPATLEVHAHAVSEGLDQVDLAGLAAEVVSRFSPADVSDGLIVRSSATVEDATSQSFAGQFLSERCDTSVAGLAHAIRAVWKSSTEPHVLAYRSVHAQRSHCELDRSSVEMGVVVQPFSAFDLAGIVFSRHPTVPVRGWMLLEYLDAPPSQLVSGEVVPHRCRVSRDYRVVWEHHCPGRPTLSHDALTELGSTVVSLSDLFGGDVDVEWGVRAGRLRVLQCRRATMSP